MPTCSKHQRYCFFFFFFDIEKVDFFPDVDALMCTLAFYGTIRKHMDVIFMSFNWLSSTFPTLHMFQATCYLLYLLPGGTVHAYINCSYLFGSSSF